MGTPAHLHEVKRVRLKEIRLKGRVQHLPVDPCPVSSILHAVENQPHEA